MRIFQHKSYFLLSKLLIVILIANTVYSIWFPGLRIIKGIKRVAFEFPLPPEIPGRNLEQEAANAVMRNLKLKQGEKWTQAASRLYKKENLDKGNEWQQGGEEKQARFIPKDGESMADFDKRLELFEKWYDEPYP